MKKAKKKNIKRMMGKKKRGGGSRFGDPIFFVIIFLLFFCSSSYFSSSSSSSSSSSASFSRSCNMVIEFVGGQADILAEQQAVLTNKGQHVAAFVDVSKVYNGTPPQKALR